MVDHAIFGSDIEGRVTSFARVPEAEQVKAVASGHEDLAQRRGPAGDAALGE